MANVSTRTMRLLVKLQAEGSYKPQAAELIGLSKAANEAQNALSSIGKGSGSAKAGGEFKAIGQAVKTAEQDINRFRAAQDRIQDSAIRAARATGDYVGALRLIKGELALAEQGSIRYNKLIAEQAQVTKQSMREIARAAEDAGPKFNAFEQIATGALRQVGALAVETSLKAGAALLKFGADSIGVAGDFEATMNRFESKTGDLDQAGLKVDNFREKFLQLGKDTQFSAQQAGDAAIELVKGGVSIEQVMGGATDATLALAAAGELGLAPAAGIVAKQLGVWQQEAGGAANVANRLSQAANASVVDVDELALGLANVGGVARAAGLSFDETVTAMGLIAPGFSSASDAGTSLKVLLTALQPVTSTAAEAFAELGLLTEQGTSKFYDAQGSFVGMTKATEILAEATRDLSEADQTRLIKLAFGQDAQRAALELAKHGAEGYDKFAASMDKVGSATDQAAKLNRGFNFAMEQLGGSLETAQIVIGSKLLPAGTALINDFFIPAVNGAITVAENFDKIANIISTAFLPSLIGLTAAGSAWGIAALAATPPTAALGTTIGLATLAAGKAALAFAALALPIAAIGVAVGGTVLAIQNYNEYVGSTVEATLRLADGYGKSADALKGYQAIAASSGDLSSKNRLSMEYERATIERLRQELEQASAKYYETGSDSDYWLGRITALNGELETHSAKLNVAVSNNKELIEANKQNADAMRLSREGLVNFAVAADQGVSGAEAIALALRPIGEEAEKLQASLAKIYETGFGFFDASVQGTVGYQAKIAELTAAHNTKMEELRRTGTQKEIDAEMAGHATMMQNDALAYAQQEAAQLASLGRQLMAYTQVQGELNGISQAKIDEMNAIIAEGYGVQVSAMELAYGQMMGSIDAWAANGAQGSEEVVAGLIATGNTAVDTQQKMDALAKQYTAELLHNFDPAKDDVDELTAALARIPARVNAEVSVHTSYSQSGNPPPTGSNVRYGGNAGAVEARAFGGPVSANTPYWVGDNRDGSLNKTSELFVPKQSGWIVPAKQAMNMASSATGGFSAQRGTGGDSSGRNEYSASRMSSGGRGGFSSAERTSGSRGGFGSAERIPSGRSGFSAQRMSSSGRGGFSSASPLGTYARAGMRSGGYSSMPTTGGGSGGFSRAERAPNINVTVAPGAVVVQGSNAHPREIESAVARGITSAVQQIEARTRAEMRGR